MNRKSDTGITLLQSTMQKIGIGCFPFGVQLMPLYYVSERAAEKSPVLHGLLTAQTYFYVFLVFSSFDGADHCTDHIMAVFICEGGEIKLKDIIVGHVEGNGLCIHT